MSKKVLVVDDDIDFQLQLRIQLEAAGFEVFTADGEKDALEVLSKVNPDLAIVDLMMEHMDGGFILSYQIKKTNPGIPVILVTGVTRETGVEFDIPAGEENPWLKADAMLAKPIRFEQLKKEIDRLLKG